MLKLLGMLVLIGLGTTPSVLRLTNPQPLLLGMEVPRTPIDFRSSGLSDVGAYEYMPPFTRAVLGDVSFDYVVNGDDWAWCRLCWNGPDIPCPATLRKIATQERMQVACWLCDFDRNGDVSLMDFGIHQNLLGVQRWPYCRMWIDKRCGLSLCP
jgi:hypothetical protein